MKCPIFFHRRLLLVPTLRRGHLVRTLTPHFLPSILIFYYVHLKLDSQCEYAHSCADFIGCQVSMCVLRENIWPESNTLPQILHWLSFGTCLQQNGPRWCAGGAFRVNTSLLTYLLTYLLTARSRVLLEKLTGFQLVKKFLTSYGTRRFITAFTSACHLSLS